MLKFIFSFFALLITATLIAEQPTMQGFLQEYYLSEEKNIKKYSKLLYAAEKNYVDICLRLLNSGEDPNFVSNDKKIYTPFMFAILNNNSELVKIMIEKGADVNLVSGDFPDSTPLLVSVTMNVDNSIVKLLCDAGSKAIKLPLWNWDYQNPLSYSMTKLDVKKFFMIAETLSINEILSTDQIKNNLFQRSMNWYLIENGDEKAIQIAEYLVNKGVSIETKTSSALPPVK